MGKLQKLLDEIIIEEQTKLSLIREYVSPEVVVDAIKNRYNVNIEYDDPDLEPGSAPSKRYIQPYNFSDTTADNAAIRAYQIFGGSKTVPNAWKIFRLDRIRSWRPTKIKFAKPISDKDPRIPKFNPNGDRTMKRVHNIVKF